MGIFGSFSKASKVIADAKRDIDLGRKNRPKDELQTKRQQKNGGKKRTRRGVWVRRRSW